MILPCEWLLPARRLLEERTVSIQTGPSELDPQQRQPALSVRDLGHHRISHDRRLSARSIRVPGQRLGEVDPNAPKSIDKRQNQLRRVLQYSAASQRAFQKLNSACQFSVSSSFHPVWSGWYAVDYRPRTAKPLPQPVSLQIGAGFAASSLALVNWMA